MPALQYQQLAECYDHPVIFAYLARAFHTALQLNNTPVWGFAEPHSTH